MQQSNINNFQVMQKLGEGAFSTVFRVKRISDGAEYAMKKVKMIKLSEREKQNALNEVRILASIQHPNIIGYKEAFFEDATSCLCIILEYADGGDLLKLISNHKKKLTTFTEKELWYYSIQIIRGLKALHDLKICHRDIKCANLFLTKEGVIKLGDLNVSKVAKKGAMLHTQTGTPYYASPEVWKDRPYDFKSDLWSTGCVIYEMATLNPPFRAPNMNGLYHKVLRGIYEPIPSQYSQDLSFLIRSCLQVSPVVRPTCDQILATPGLLNHLSGTLQGMDMGINLEKEGLLNTIKVPRDLGQITERLPKSQYHVIRRTNSLPPEKLENMPEINKKESLIQAASRMFEQKDNRSQAGLANQVHNVLEERKRSVLATIEENEPLTRGAENNHRSAEPHLHKNKVNNLSKIEESKGNLHETRTPNIIGDKTRNLNNKLNEKMSVGQAIALPRIQSTRASENTGLGPIIQKQNYNNPIGNYNKNAQRYRGNIHNNGNANVAAGLPRIHEYYGGERHHNQENISSNINPIYMSKGSDIYQKGQIQQKKILQQVYGAGRVISNKRDIDRSIEDLSTNQSRINQKRIL